MVEAGDHIVVIAEAIHGYLAGRRTLIYFNSSYQTLRRELALLDLLDAVLGGAHHEQQSGGDEHAKRKAGEPFDEREAMVAGRTRRREG
jgi:hypothetical protein